MTSTANEETVIEETVINDAPKGVALRDEKTSTSLFTPEERAANPAYILIESALRMGATLDQTRELIALRREVQADEARKLFFAALAAFKAEVGPIFKSKTTKEIGRETSTKFTYTWASLDDIESAIGPILAKHGLSYTWDHDQDGPSVLTLCHVRHKAGHVETTKVRLSVAGSPGMSEHQKVQSTFQYGRRASLTSALGLSTTEEDPNASAASTEKISNAAVEELNDMLAETGINVARFLKYMDVASVVDVRAADVPKAKSAISTIYRQEQEKK